METNYTYLRIKDVPYKKNIENKIDVEFTDDAVVEGKIFDLQPSSISPTFEIIKKAERSLDGTMNVDIVAVKTNLKIAFDILNNENMQFIAEVFDIQNQETLYPDGITVEYFDFKESSIKKTIHCYIEGISYVPHIIENEIMWRDLVVELVEI